MTKEIICFIGLKTTGKDYRAKEYINQGYIKVAFADALREGLYQVIGYRPKNNEAYDKFKKENFEYKVSSFETYKVSGRVLLQNFGSVMKEITNDERFWNKKLVENIIKNNYEKIVITDVRFPYEIEEILTLKEKGYNIKFIWCCYKNKDFDKVLLDEHESEDMNKYIYYNMDKYNLEDGSEIELNKLDRILNDYYLRKEIWKYLDKK